MVNPLRSLFREPLHPPTTHFPMALFPMVVLFDLLSLLQEDGSLYTHAAFVVVLTGLITAGIAAVTGFVHLLCDVPASSRAWRVAITHMTVQLTALSVLLVSFVFRVGHVNDDNAPVMAVALGVVGTLILLFGGWLGGRLVYHHGVGVSTDRT